MIGIEPRLATCEASTLHLILLLWSLSLNLRLDFSGPSVKELATKSFRTIYICL